MPLILYEISLEQLYKKIRNKVVQFLKKTRVNYCSAFLKQRQGLNIAFLKIHRQVRSNFLLLR